VSGNLQSLNGGVGYICYVEGHARSIGDLGGLVSLWLPAKEGMGLLTETLNPYEKLADADVLKESVNSGLIAGPNATIPGIY
jgi:hypothetical protein